MSPLDELERALLQAADALRDRVSASAFIDAIGSFMLLKLVEEELAAEEQGLQSRPFGSNLFARQAARFRWSRWSELPESELAAFVDDEVFPYLASLVREAPLLASYFDGLRLDLRIGATVRTIANALDAVQLRSLPPSDCVEVIMSMFMHSTRGAVSPTPARVRDLMVKLADPQAGQSIFDPCCGGGALLGAALDHLGWAARTKPHDGKGLEETCVGVDTSAVAVRVAMVQLALRGVRTPAIRCANALGADTARTADRVFDLVLMDPPWGGRLDADSLRPEIAPFARHSESAFLALAMEVAAPRARVVATLPVGTLSRTDAATRQLRRRLLERFHVRAVLRLPKGWYSPHTSAAMTVIVAEERDADVRSGFVQFFDLASDEGGDATEHSNGPTNGIAETVIRAFRSLSSTAFEVPVGAEGLMDLPAGSVPPFAWWASNDTVRAHDDILEPDHYRPAIATASEYADPLVILREAVARQREIVCDMERLLDELERER